MESIFNGRESPKGMRLRAARLAATALLVVWSVGMLGAVPGTVDAATEQGVLLEVNVQESGDAVWTVTARYRLETTNDTAAFDRLIEDYEAGEDVGPTVTPFQELAARGENRTDRSMGIDGVTRSGEVRNRSNAGPDTPGDATGVLMLEFQWTAFANTVEDGIRIGDVFGGSWDLGADQTLVVRPPSGYSVDTVRPSTAVDGGVLRWEGPQNFGENEPAIVYLQSNNTPPPTDDPPTGDDTSWLYLLGVAIAVIGGGVVVYTWLRRDDLFEDEPTPTTTDDATGPASTPGDDTGPPPDEPPAVTPEPSVEPDDAVDPELLSDEERVERLLDDNGGRMKQADIVTETDWSNAKVSQLLSAMADDDRVEKLRIGRENLITLTDDAVEDVGDEE